MREIRDFKFAVQERLREANDQFVGGFGDGSEIEKLQDGLKFVDWFQRETLRRDWIPISWSDLESLLKREYPDKGYTETPIVCLKPGDETMYCFITKSGELQVGPYFHNTNFKRGCDLYIHRNRLTWR